MMLFSIQYSVVNLSCQVCNFYLIIIREYVIIVNNSFQGDRGRIFDK